MILATPGLTIFVLEQEGRILSSCYLNVIPNITRSARPYAIIEKVIANAAMRGRGLGKALMLEVLSVAWEAGCYKARWAAVMRAT